MLELKLSNIRLTVLLITVERINVKRISNVGEVGYTQFIDFSGQRTRRLTVCPFNDCI